jgi:hypothetical protein
MALVLFSQTLRAAGSPVAVISSPGFPMFRSPVGFGRTFACGIAVVVACCGSPALAQEWAKKMFPVTSHNFGTVAKGAKTEYRFVFRNVYKEDLHVVGVRTSCGCTSPEVTRHDLKTHETGEVQPQLVRTPTTCRSSLYTFRKTNRYSVLAPLATVPKLWLVTGNIFLAHS